MKGSKSKSGCVTCLVRRKKCDEVTPVCGHCRRLTLKCVQREHDTPVPAADRTALTMTSLRAKQLHIQPPVSPGHPRFRSELEKKVSQESPALLSGFLSRIADPAFHSVQSIGRFCIQSEVVREAVLAYAAYIRGQEDADAYRHCVKSYQSCIIGLRDASIRQSPNQDLAMTAILFLGLLEVSG